MTVSAAKGLPFSSPSFVVVEGMGSGGVVTTQTRSDGFWGETHTFRVDHSGGPRRLLLSVCGARGGNGIPLGSVELDTGTQDSNLGSGHVEAWYPLGLPRMTLGGGLVTGELCLQLQYVHKPSNSTEPCLLFARVSAAAHLAPRVDGTAHPHVSFSFLGIESKSHTVKASLDPVWFGPESDGKPSTYTIFKFPPGTSLDDPAFSSKLSVSVWCDKPAGMAAIPPPSFTHPDPSLVSQLGIEDAYLEVLAAHDAAASESGYAFSAASHGAFMGSISLDLKDPPLYHALRNSSKPVSRWYPLSPSLPGMHSLVVDIPDGVGSLGSIRLKTLVVSDSILSVRHYAPLIYLMEDPALRAVSALGKYTKAREDAARALVHVFAGRRRAVWLLNALNAAEVRATKDPAIIFRGNTIATKVNDMYLKLIGLEYLSKVLSPSLTFLYKTSLPLEVDPSRLEEGMDLDANWKYLKIVANEICDAIFNSVPLIPLPLRAVFGFLQQEVLDQFPEDDTTPFTVVSAFLFLRFFCAAILGPTLFGLAETLPTPVVARSLTLVAKTLQNLANLMTFGPKEPFMAPMNDLILSRMDEMKSFINEVSSLPKDAPRLVDTFSLEMCTPDDIDLEAQLALVHQHFARCIDDIASDASNDVPLIHEDRALLPDLVAVVNGISSLIQNPPPPESDLVAVADRISQIAPQFVGYSPETGMSETVTDAASLHTASELYADSQEMDRKLRSHTMSRSGTLSSARARALAARKRRKAETQVAEGGLAGLEARLMAQKEAEDGGGAGPSSSGSMGATRANVVSPSTFVWDQGEYEKFVSSVTLYSKTSQQETKDVFNGASLVTFLASLRPGNDRAAACAVANVLLSRYVIRPLTGLQSDPIRDSGTTLYSLHEEVIAPGDKLFRLIDKMRLSVFLEDVVTPVTQHRLFRGLDAVSYFVGMFKSPDRVAITQFCHQLLKQGVFKGYTTAVFEDSTLFFEVRSPEEVVLDKPVPLVVTTGGASGGGKGKAEVAGGEEGEEEDEEDVEDEDTRAAEAAAASIEAQAMLVMIKWTNKLFVTKGKPALRVKDGRSDWKSGVYINLVVQLCFPTFVKSSVFQFFASPENEEQCYANLFSALDYLVGVGVGVGGVGVGGGVGEVVEKVMAGDQRSVLLVLNGVRKGRPR